MDSQTYMKSFEKARIGSHCEFRSEQFGLVFVNLTRFDREIVGENDPFKEIIINQEKVKYILSV